MTVLIYIYIYIKPKLLKLLQFSTLARYLKKKNINLKKEKKKKNINTRGFLKPKPDIYTLPSPFCLSQFSNPYTIAHGCRPPTPLVAESF